MIKHYSVVSEPISNTSADLTRLPLVSNSASVVPDNPFGHAATALLVRETKSMTSRTQFKGYVILSTFVGGETSSKLPHCSI
jgi:hypothetical protein